MSLVQRQIKIAPIYFIFSPPRGDSIIYTEEMIFRRSLIIGTLPIEISFLQIFRRHIIRPYGVITLDWLD